MPQHDFEAIAQKVEQRAVSEGRALADYLAEHFADGLREIDFERHRIASFIFDRTASGVVALFPELVEADKPILQSRAAKAVRTAFKARLAN